MHLYSKNSGTVEKYINMQKISIVPKKYTSNL